MSATVAEAADLLLSIPGSAADHLYREGSAKASFWEAVFGSSLSAKRRTRVSSLPDGTRMFEVPLRELEAALLDRARTWLSSNPSGESDTETLAALSGNAVRVRLVGLQAQGSPVTSFTLRFEGSADAQTAMALKRWFDADRATLSRDSLIPFGFTPAS